jgi:hypothetical protein
MAKVLTDDSLTQEEAQIVARRAGAALKGAAKSVPKAAARAARAGSEMLDPTLDSASGMASRAVEQAGAMVRNIGDQASVAGDALYQQSARAGQYLNEQGARAGLYVKRNVNQYPLTAVLVAGAIGYMTAYLFQALRDRPN